MRERVRERGAACSTACRMKKNNALKILHYVVVGEAQHAIAARLEPSVTHNVVSNALLKIVALAIDLNDEPARVSSEIPQGGGSRPSTRW